MSDAVYYYYMPLFKQGVSVQFGQSRTSGIHAGRVVKASKNGC